MPKPAAIAMEQSRKNHMLGEQSAGKAKSNPEIALEEAGKSS
jgi:hypothetical protein